MHHQVRFPSITGLQAGPALLLSIIKRGLCDPSNFRPPGVVCEVLQNPGAWPLSPASQAELLGEPLPSCICQQWSFLEKVHFLGEVRLSYLLSLPSDQILKETIIFCPRNIQPQAICFLLPLSLLLLACKPCSFWCIHCRPSLRQVFTIIIEFTFIL